MFSVSGVVATIIEEARRRQHRRRRTVALTALGLALVAAAVFGLTQRGSTRQPARSAAPLPASQPGVVFVAGQGANGVTIRRVVPTSGAGPYGKLTVVSSGKLQRSPNASVTVVVDPKTGAIELRTVRTVRPR